MGAKTLKPRTASLYDQDFAVWTSETARLLRAGRFDEVDIEHVAEEIEDMGKRDKRELHSRLTVLLLHLLKWNSQPNKQSSGWQSTIITQRAELEQLFEDSPSLRRTIGAAVLKVYPAALRAAVVETGLPTATFPRDCPFTPEQLMDPSFLQVK
jgi:hypothetical protein